MNKHQLLGTNTRAITQESFQDEAGFLSINQDLKKSKNSIEFLG